jgi:hypothetical protein
LCGPVFAGLGLLLELEVPGADQKVEIGGRGGADGLHVEIRAARVAEIDVRRRDLRGLCGLEHR